MADEIVVLREFGNELEARMAETILYANGVPAQVVADTAGGAYPSMALLYPIRLLVHAADAALARELLDTPVEGAAGEGDDAETFA